MRGRLWVALGVLVMSVLNEKGLRECSSGLQGKGENLMLSQVVMLRKKIWANGQRKEFLVFSRYVKTQPAWPVPLFPVGPSASSAVVHGVF
jgi:hypothetical protein